MKWYKKLVNRLLGNDEDTYNQENYDNEKDTDDNESNPLQGEKPTFRFPIITDAEIYGWNEIKPAEDKDDPSTIVLNTKVDDEIFEPTPLFRNERWRGEQLEPKVFRARDKVSSEHVDNLDTDKRNVEDQNLLLKKTIIKKSSNRPFTPTSVPSPIYGYITPEKEEITLENREVKPIVKEEKYFEPSPEIIEVEEIEELDDLTDEVDEINEIEMADINLLNAFEEESPLLINKKHTDDERVAEVKKERIVPFNVLMLQSDKKKIQNVKPEMFQQVEQVQIKQNVQLEKEVPVVMNTDDVDCEPHYVFPSLDLLIEAESQIVDTEWLESQSTKLVEALSYFAVKAIVIEAMQGPTVTRFELTVGKGTKVSKIRNLTDDLKLALAAQEIRIQAPIPGKSSIGIEIPNRTTRPVRISEVISTKEFQDSTSPLEAVLGLSLTGKPVTIDLRKMPHGMIAGATGSGKSVCINSLLISLLYKATPTDLKMMLIDPKMVELAPFNGIPHLISPVITDVKAANAALKWAVAEMERRYELLAHAGVRDIERYNKAATESRSFSLKMPYLLIVIDELADLMMMAPADVEVSISRVAQKARACGIHLIIATQRPSVDVITGTIKANIPTRIAFSVSSQIDSRTIIDTQGAERLLGRGDMLYIGNGQSAAVRLQGTFVTDDEIERIIEHVKGEAEPNYLFGQDDLLANAVAEEEYDPLFEDACLFIFENESASTSSLQRNFSIGYNRAAKLMDQMEKRGFISGQRGSKARDVFITEKDLSQLKELVN